MSKIFIHTFVQYLFNQLKNLYKMKPIILIPVVFILLIFTNCTGPDSSKGNSVRREIWVNLLAYGNQYVCPDEMKADSLISNRTEAKDWERFTLIYLDNNQVALKSFKNKYVSLDPAGSKYLIAKSDSINESSKFTLIQVDESFSAFQTSTGEYVCSDQYIGNKLIADRQKIGDWEKFKIIELKN
jgi:Fascin domain